jgi:ABC-type nickel/cobalt efflux system permease component RcnA
MVEGPAAVFAAAVGLGLLHGIEPGHGWPLAAGYALARPHRYLAGLAAGAILGAGHLISSIAVVLAFFGLQQWLALGALGWMRYLAGGLLIALGLWELRPRAGHSHRHRHPHHSHTHVGDRVHWPEATAAPDGSAGTGAGKDLWGLAGAAFALGFAHEEEFEIIALCAGSHLCLEVMAAYALTVLLAIVALTLALIAGFERWRGRLEGWAPHLPKVSAAILIAMGLGFLAGVV